jgi:PAS domain-containing protein
MGTYAFYFESAFQAIPSPSVIIDNHGNILTVNRAWIIFHLQNGGTLAENEWLSINYFDTCRKTTVGPTGNNLTICKGIEAVIAGEQNSFSIEYPCHAPDCSRWYLMQVNPLGNNLDGAIITNTDISEL